MDDPLLIVGLGNPGGDYARTRHNAGFMVVQEFGRRHGANWSFERKFEARVARVELGGRKIWLCEPQTFMNLSGSAVAGVAGFYRVPVSGILVVADDADLPVGHLRLRPSGSSGGHHGHESIESHLGTREYARIKVGIGRREGQRQIAGHVLGKFDESEWVLMKEVLARATDQAETWATAGIQRAMNQFNGALESAETEGKEQ
jgi:PTH1 family peptidyl-tRNA hydrolase